MKINSINNKINFGKTLSAKCDLVRPNHKKVECNIFQLNLQDDKDYFAKVWTSKPWEDAKYLWDMDAELRADISGERIYVMESKAGKCLGYLVIATSFTNPKQEELIFLETCPKYQKNKDKRPLKYIGETLLAFATGKLDTSKTNALVIKDYSKAGKPFYKENCGFKERNDKKGTLVLPNKNFSKLIARNESHTNSKIRYTI